MAKNKSTLTPEQAKAELERRAKNRALKAKGEPKITESDPELVNATSAELKKIIKP